MYQVVYGILYRVRHILLVLCTCVAAVYRTILSLVVVLVPVLEVTTWLAVVRRRCVLTVKCAPLIRMCMIILLNTLRERVSLYTVQNNLKIALRTPESRGNASKVYMDVQVRG